MVLSGREGEPLGDGVAPFESTTRNLCSLMSRHARTALVRASSSEVEDASAMRWRTLSSVLLSLTACTRDG